MNILNSAQKIIRNNAGAINTLSGLYRESNLVQKLSANTKLMSDRVSYRPSEWPGIQNSSVAMVMTYTNVGGIFFDAVLSETAEETMTICQHPTQLGADIADHAYRNPTKISLSVAISDAMGSYGGDGYPGAEQTKSGRAYAWMVELQRLRIPLKVRTHFKVYENMLITSVSYDHDNSTMTGLRANIELQEIMMVSVGTEKVSAREWTTGAQNSTQAQPEPIPDRTMARQIEIGLGRG